MTFDPTLGDLPAWPIRGPARYQLRGCAAIAAQASCVAPRRAHCRAVFSACSRGRVWPFRHDSRRNRVPCCSQAAREHADQRPGVLAAAQELDYPVALGSSAVGQRLAS
jgi:hypothetical protein